MNTIKHPTRPVFIFAIALGVTLGLVHTVLAHWNVDEVKPTPKRVAVPIVIVWTPAAPQVGVAMSWWRWILGEDGPVSGRERGSGTSDG
jgi:hypothetical protein